MCDSNADVRMEERRANRVCAMAVTEVTARIVEITVTPQRMQAHTTIRDKAYKILYSGGIVIVE